MSPKPSALETQTKEEMNLEENEEGESKPATFVIGKGSDDGVSEKDGEAEIFTTPEVGKKKLVAAKAAASEKEKENKEVVSTSRSSTDYNGPGVVNDAEKRHKDELRRKEREILDLRETMDDMRREFERQSGNQAQQFQNEVQRIVHETLEQQGRQQYEGQQDGWQGQ